MKCKLQAGNDRCEPLPSIVGQGRYYGRLEEIRRQNSMRTVTLAEVLAGAERAAKRVAKWPDWKLELSPSTRCVLADRQMARSLAPKEIEVLLGRHKDWGAAVGAAFEALVGMGLMTSCGGITGAGKRVRELLEEILK